MINGKKEAFAGLGGPGVGKGTQLKVLKGKYIYHLSTGDVVKNLPDTEPERSYKEAVRIRGELVPDGPMMRYFNREIDRIIQNGTYDPFKQILGLDGIPRTLEQIDMISGGIIVTGAIFLDVPDDILRERSIARGRADETRSDEAKAEALENRIKIYHRDTMPVIEYYKEHLGNRFYRIDATGTIEETRELTRKAVISLGYQIDSI